jgi:hypothetical protein
MIFWIITTSLIEENKEERETQYTRAISDVVRRCSGLPIKIIIIENTGRSESFLDKLGAEVFYTKNNSIPAKNYGIKELCDVLECIQHYSIEDDDHIVKMTGRYFLSEACPFLDAIVGLDHTPFDAIIKYGWWEPSPRTRHANCITGLICMKAKYIKQIQNPEHSDTTTFLEHRSAEGTFPIADDLVCSLTTLGIHINPKCNNNNTFFEV